MWNDLLFSINIVLPILLMIGTGFGAQRLKLHRPAGNQRG